MLGLSLLREKNQEVILEEFSYAWAASCPTHSCLSQPHLANAGITSEIACTGHWLAHTPQLWHNAVFTTALPAGSREIAWAGQTLTQRPQPVQRSELTWATHLTEASATDRVVGTIICPPPGLCAAIRNDDVIGAIGGLAIRPRPPLPRLRI